MLHLDHNFEQVGKEREERREWERHSEERNKTKLDNGFVVEENKSICRWLHMDLPHDHLVHLQMRNIKIIFLHFGFINLRFE